MLDGRERDKLAETVQGAEISALHRALDAAWHAGYKAGHGDNEDGNTLAPDVQASIDQAIRQREARAKPSDDLEKGDHPVTAKFARVWGER